MNIQLYLRIVCLFLGTILSGSVSGTLAREDSPAQKRLTYQALAQIRTLSSSGASFEEFRHGVLQAEDAMRLLQDRSSSDYKDLQKALSYYQSALSVWSKQTDPYGAVDSLRADEAEGASVMLDCPGIPVFRLKSADHIRIQDAVACLQSMGAAALDYVPESLK